MGKAKVIYGGKVLIDLTGDSVTPDKLSKGFTAHDKDGEPIVGTNTFDVDSTDADVSEAEVLKNKTYYARGAKRIGAMPNNGAVSGEIRARDEEYIVPLGFHDGSGRVYISASERAKIVPENIRDGITLLGIPGKMTGSEGVKVQAKTATPSTVEQVILPDSGYTHLSQVTVEPIPYKETTTSTGGIVVTIG